MNTCCAALGLVLALGAGASPLHGQCADIPDNPVNDTECARFGYASVMNTDGTVALVSGPGFDLGDGLVRSFERVGGTWQEGLAYGARQQTGEQFGWAIAMDDAGTRAIITAPRETVILPGFFLAAGAAYVFERDTGTGEWSQTQMWNAPEPGFENNFGSSCAINAAGDIAVIGQSNVIGTIFQDRVDGAFVSTHDGSAWGPLIELVPSPPPGDTSNFGESVAISPDGMLIAVAAPQSPAFADPPESGLVYVFENQGGTWVQTDMLSRVIPGASFNSFGTALGFDGDTLLVCNPSEDTKGPNFEPGPPICIYERSGNAYPAEPDELMFQTAAAPAPGGFVVRNDTLLVTGWQFAFSGGLMQYIRDAANPDRTWKFASSFKSENRDKYGSPTGYGFSAAMADDPNVLLVGEPRWSPSDFSVNEPGLINFPDRVFRETGFEISPDNSFLTVMFDFPGLETQFLFVRLLGLFDFSFPENCDGAPLPVQAVIDHFTLTTVEDEFVLDGPLGTPITLSEVVIGLTMDGASDPSPVDSSGFTSFEGMTVKVDAMVKVGLLPAFPFSAEGGQTSPMPALFFGGRFGEPLRLSIPDLNLDFSPDLGLGALNPTVTAQGDIDGSVPSQCPADLAEPFGVLNFFDLVEYIALYNAQDPGADLAAPFGSLNFFDVFAYITAFNAGCP